MIVSDTGPLISFSRIDQLELIRGVAGTVFIPDAVYSELVTQGQGRPGSALPHDWLHRKSVADISACHALPDTLHAGEKEAIILAEEYKMPLLIDEKRGRAIALARGIAVFGSLGLLARAKQQGLIDEVFPIVQMLQNAGYWIDRGLLLAFMQSMDEMPSGE